MNLREVFCPLRTCCNDPDQDSNTFRPPDPEYILFAFVVFRFRAPGQAIMSTTHWIKIPLLDDIPR